jgi:thioredoxin-related protein
MYSITGCRLCKADRYCGYAHKYRKDTMSDTAVEAKVEKKFEIKIIYNGVEKEFKVENDETVKQVRERAVQTFGAQQGHLLALYTTAGQELTNEAQTVKQAGIRAHDKFLLRPSQVRGG